MTNMHFFICTLKKHCQRHNGPRILTPYNSSYLNNSCLKPSCRGNSRYGANTEYSLSVVPLAMFASLCLKNWGGREGGSKDTQRLQRTFKDPRNHSRISQISFVGFPDYPQGMHFPFHKLLSVEILATLVAPLLIWCCDPLLKISQQLKELSCTPPIDKRANLNIIPSTPRRNSPPYKWDMFWLEF